MNTSEQQSKGKSLSFTDVCKLITQTSTLSQTIPYYGRVPARKMEEVRKMATSF